MLKYFSIQLFFYKKLCLIFSYLHSNYKKKNFNFFACLNFILTVNLQYKANTLKILAGVHNARVSRASLGKIKKKNENLITIHLTLRKASEQRYLIFFTQKLTKSTILTKYKVIKFFLKMIIHSG
jgi:hypothetical protein